LTGSSVIQPKTGIDYDAVTLPEGAVGIRLASGETFLLGMSGTYQATNAALAVATTRALASTGFTVSDGAIAQGLAMARLPGRFEAVQHQPLVVLDGAHNLQKIGALINDLPSLVHLPEGARRIVVLGALEAKDHTGIVRLVARHADELVLTRPRVLAKPGANPSDLIGEAREAGFAGPITVEDDPRVAVERAIEQADAARGDLVLVTGSLYLIGNLRGLWYPDDEIVRQRTAWPISIDS
jgi:dihydrofolate synthase/folylpolyglutamate synthase